MRLTAGQLRQFDDQGYCFFPNCFSEDEIALMRTEGDAILASNARKSGARNRRAAHRLRGAQVQRGVPPARASPAPGGSAGAVSASLTSTSSSSTPRPPSRATYGNGTRTTAPGARRRHARAARDEHRGVSRRSASFQRRADAGAAQPQGRHACRRATISTRLPIRSGRSIRTPSRGSAARPSTTASPASWRRPASPAGADVPRQPGHASAPNITPYPRKIFYLTLCAVSNHITKFTRPEFIAHRDFTPIEQVSDDALAEYAARIASRRNDVSVVTPPELESSPA